MNNPLTPVEELSMHIKRITENVPPSWNTSILLAALELALADAVLHEFLELIVPEERSRSVIAKNYAREVEDARIKLYEALKQ